MSDLMRPAEVAKHLQVSGSTLRQWSHAFGPWLSASAQGRLLATGGHGQRRYDQADVETLVAIKGMLASGADFAEVQRRLEEGPDTRPPTEDATSSTTTAIELPPEARLAIVSLQQALGDKDKTIGALEQTVAVQARLISALEEQVAMLKRQPAEESPGKTPAKALSPQETPAETPAKALSPQETPAETPAASPDYQTPSPGLVWSIEAEEQPRTPEERQPSTFLDWLRSLFTR